MRAIATLCFFEQKKSFSHCNLVGIKEVSCSLYIGYISGYIFGYISGYIFGYTSGYIFGYIRSYIKRA